MITAELVRKQIDACKENHSVTAWIDLAWDRGYRWALVFGWDEEFNGVLAKIAYVSRHSLMHEYDIDWTMPYNEEGEVDYTEILVNESDVSWFESQWNRIKSYIGEYNYDK